MLFIIFWGWWRCYKCCHFLANLSLNVVIKKVVTQPRACNSITFFFLKNAKKIKKKKKKKKFEKCYSHKILFSTKWNISSYVAVNFSSILIWLKKLINFSKPLNRKRENWISLQISKSRFFDSSILRLFSKLESFSSQVQVRCCSNEYL